MKKKLTVILTIFIAFGVVLSACGAPAATPTATVAPTKKPTRTPTGNTIPAATSTPTPIPVSILDGLGRRINMVQPASRIVSISPGNLEILCAIGAQDQVVGRDEFSDYPPEASVIPTVGSSLQKLNPEVIAQLKPDLVLLAEITPPEQISALEALGLVVFYVANPTDLDSMYQNILTIAALVGREKEAVHLVTSLRQRVTNVMRIVARSPFRVRVFYEIDGADPAKPWTAGSGTFIDQLIAFAGGENIASQTASGWAQISQEAILAAAPDVILLGDVNYGVTPLQVARRPGWSEIRAVSNGNIFTFNDDLVSRPGPRLVDGLEQLALTLHPELFQ